VVLRPGKGGTTNLNSAVGSPAMASGRANAVNGVAAMIVPITKRSFPHDIGSLIFRRWRFCGAQLAIRSQGDMGASSPDQRADPLTDMLAPPSSGADSS